MNQTILKFNYPESLIKKYDYWVVMLRPEQITLGSLIIAYIPNVENLSDVDKGGFIELQMVIKDIEETLKKLFNYDKINYLTLMMQDKQVHMHVIPRFSKNKIFKNKIFFDKGWPSLPDLNYINKLDSLELKNLKDYIILNY